MRVTTIDTNKLINGWEKRGKLAWFNDKYLAGNLNV